MKINRKWICFFSCCNEKYINITNKFITEEPIIFTETDDAIEAAADSSAQIICRTEKPVSECQWSWRLLNQTKVWNIEVKKFPSFGVNKTDCSIKFKNVLPEQEGLWTCGVQSDTDTSSSFIQTKPIKFFVSEGRFGFIIPLVSSNNWHILQDNSYLWNLLINSSGIHTAFARYPGSRRGICPAQMPGEQTGRTMRVVLETPQFQ